MPVDATLERLPSVAREIRRDVVATLGRLRVGYMMQGLGAADLFAALYPSGLNSGSAQVGAAVGAALEHPGRVHLWLPVVRGNPDESLLLAELTLGKGAVRWCAAVAISPSSPAA